MLPDTRFAEASSLIGCPGPSNTITGSLASAINCAAAGRVTGSLDTYSSVMLMKDSTSQARSDAGRGGVQCCLRSRISDLQAVVRRLTRRSIVRGSLPRITTLRLEPTRRGQGMECILVGPDNPSAYEKYASLHGASMPGRRAVWCVIGPTRRQ